MTELRLKELSFDWASRDRGNPTEMALTHDDYAAYVLIPYGGLNGEVYDPKNGVGPWNAVANNKGKSGFPSREAAMRHCEDVIRNDALAVIEAARKWVA